MAMVFTDPGAPLIARPQRPRPLSTGELRVTILSCTLCQSDLATFTGRRREAVPTVLGHEMVGAIVEFGPGTATIDAAGRACQVGDRIVWSVVASCGTCDRCQRDLPQKCRVGFKYGHAATTLDAPDGGGLADVLTLHRGTTWFRVPDALPTPIAALATCAGATVVAVLAAAGPIAGRRVLVSGAGLLGVLACAMAADACAASITARDPDARARSQALRFGATTVEAPNEADPEERFDIALELAGRAESVQAGLNRLEIGGTLVLAGTVSNGNSIPFDPERCVRGLHTVRGVHNYHPRDLGTALEFLTRTSSTIPHHDLIAGTFALADAAAAFAAAPAAPGRRIVVCPGAAGDRS
jgi:putative phosphonate catabolism associated alcohol dehydrogenase